MSPRGWDKNRAREADSRQIGQSEGPYVFSFILSYLTLTAEQNTGTNCHRVSLHRLKCRHSNHSLLVSTVSLFLKAVSLF